MNSSTHHAEAASVEHSVFKLEGVYCLGCATAIEEALRAQRHVVDVRLNWKANMVHVGYDPAKIGREDIERVIAATGCECESVEARGEVPKHRPPPERRLRHLGHGVDVQPEWSALLMSLSSIIVAVNAVLLKGVEKDLGEPGIGKTQQPALTSA